MGNFGGSTKSMVLDDISVKSMNFMMKSKSNASRSFFFDISLMFSLLECFETPVKWSYHQTVVANFWSTDCHPNGRNESLAGTGVKLGFFNW